MKEYEIESGSSDLSGKIYFAERIPPVLPHGDYTIEVETKLNLTIETDRLTQNLAVATRPFSIEERDVYSIFPSENACGIYKDVLPHIVFNSRCYPWERSLKGDSENKKPWVALHGNFMDCYNYITERFQSH